MTAGICLPVPTQHNTPLLTVLILAAYTCAHSLGGGQEWWTQRKKKKEKIRSESNSLIYFSLSRLSLGFVGLVTVPWELSIERILLSIEPAFSSCCPNPLSSSYPACIYCHRMLRLRLRLYSFVF